MDNEFFSVNEFHNTPEVKDFQAIEYRRQAETSSCPEIKQVKESGTAEGEQSAKAKSVTEKPDINEIRKNIRAEAQSPVESAPSAAGCAPAETAASAGATTTAAASSGAGGVALGAAGITGTVAVVAATVAISVVAVFVPPKVNDIQVICGCDCAYYSITVDNLDEENDYYIYIPEVGYRRQITPNGTYTDIFSSLQPSQSYSLNIVGSNDSLTDVGAASTVFTSSLVTSGDCSPLALFDIKPDGQEGIYYNIYVSDRENVFEDYTLTISAGELAWEDIEVYSFT